MKNLTAWKSENALRVEQKIVCSYYVTQVAYGKRLSAMKKYICGHGKI